jgi:hypothetical protein
LPGVAGTDQPAIKALRPTTASRKREIPLLLGLSEKVDGERSSFGWLPCLDSNENFLYWQIMVFADSNGK